MTPRSPRSPRRALALPALLALLAPLAGCAAGCAGTGQPEIAYDAYAVGVAPREVTSGDWTVILEQATVAFGPVHFCASATGSATLCETALAEITDITAVDALDPAPQPLGLVRGFTGTIRSASFDYGIHWFITEPQPEPAPAAPGGHSARLRGRATHADGRVLDFTADIDVEAQFQGQRAVPSIPASATVGEEGARLEVRFDAAAWLQRVDFDALAADAETDAPIAITPGSTAHDALVIAMSSQRPPELLWTNP